MATPSSSKGARAVVLGGGIAGLTAAIALATRFEEVCVVERDRFRAEPCVREHVPQGHHVHVLLARGLDEIAKIVPELPRWLDEAGLRQGDLTRDVRMNFGGTWLPAVESGIPLRPCTRPVMEHLLLRAARERPNLRWYEGHRVLGLEGQGRVEAVRLRDDAGREHRLDADLVVEASGRASKLTTWLVAMSVDAAPEEAVDARLSYASCLLRPPPGAAGDWLIVVRSSRFPDEPQMAVLMQVDDEHWLSAVISYAKVPSPKDHAELLDVLARRLGPPHDAWLRDTQPASEIHHYGNTTNRRRHYGKVANWPERLVALGDSACSLNPRYGQGMTVAALGVSMLVTKLEQHWARRGTLDGFARRYQRALDRMLDVPWQMALMEDRLWAAHCDGERPGRLDGLLQRGLQRMFETVFTDSDTYVRFLRVAHMLDGPTHLMTPRTLAKLAIPRLRRNTA